MNNRTLVKSYLLRNGKVSGAILEWTEQGILGAIVEGNVITLTGKNYGDRVFTAEDIHTLKILCEYWKNARDDWSWFERFTCYTSGENYQRQGWEYTGPRKDTYIKTFPDDSQIKTWDEYGDVREPFMGEPYSNKEIVQTHILQRVDGVPEVGKNYITGAVFRLRDRFEVEARRFRLDIRINDERAAIKSEETDFIHEVSDFIRNFEVQK